MWKQHKTAPMFPSDLQSSLLSICLGVEFYGFLLSCFEIFPVCLWMVLFGVVVYLIADELKTSIDLQNGKSLWIWCFFYSWIDADQELKQWILLALRIFQYKFWWDICIIGTPKHTRAHTYTHKYMHAYTCWLCLCMTVVRERPFQFYFY